MLRIGLILLGIACTLMLALAAGGHFGWIQFGPCGPDPFGFCLLAAAALSGFIGILVLLAGIVVAAARRIRSEASTLQL